MGVGSEVTTIVSDDNDSNDGDAGSGGAAGDPGVRFTVELARQMFSFRGKSPDGQGVDTSIVERHYHPNVHFRDAIQELWGRDEVVTMLRRFPQRCKELRCTVHRIVHDGDVMFVEWTTETIIHDRIPPLVDDGCSRLVLDEDGRVIDHRDYFDLWGDMIDAFPPVSKVYRALVKHME